MSIQKINREILYRGSSFSLVRDSFVYPGDKNVEVDMIDHPGAVAIVPFLDSEHLVLLRQYRPALESYIWEIPAGKLKPGEEPLCCAERELIEETGYRAGRLQYLSSIVRVPGYSNDRTGIFAAFDLLKGEQRLDDDELLEVRIFSCASALAMIGSGEIRDAKTICGIFLARLMLSL
ncbi:MAG: NUDIX hydrolase [Deltaproteobacteria bacterium]|nr:NUDIX hydrolase [Deltaproteobacteria bacterium]